MGAEPYSYEIDYEENIESALNKLKQVVFTTKQFRYSALDPSSIEEALINADADGTASILDIFGVSENHQIGCLSPITEEELTQFFGTLKPSLEQVKECDEFWDSIDRCEARYVVLYSGDIPKKIYIAGYSAD